MLPEALGGPPWGEKCSAFLVLAGANTTIISIIISNNAKFQCKFMGCVNRQKKLALRRLITFKADVGWCDGALSRAQRRQPIWFLAFFRVLEPTL